MRRTTLMACALYFIAGHVTAAPTFKQAFSLYNQAVENQDLTAAVKHAESALELGKLKFGASSENAINLQYNLGLAYLENHQVNLSFDALGEVAEHYRQLKGEQSAERFNAMLDQLSTAKLLYQNGYRIAPKRYSLLVDSMQTLISDSESLSPEQQASRFYHLSKTLYKRPLSSWFFDKALKIVKKAEILLLDTVGETDAKTVEVQFQIARYRQAQKKRIESAAYYEKVINTFDKEVDTSHPLELASRAALVNIYERLGKSEQATEHCVAIGHLTPWKDDIEPTPLYRLEPMYPREQAKRGHEGWVILSFDIDTYGFVTNVELESKHGAHGFAKQAKRAVKKWRYAPKIVDGKPQVAEGMRVQLDFKLHGT